MQKTCLLWKTHRPHASWLKTWEIKNFILIIFKLVKFKLKDIGFRKIVFYVCLEFFFCQIISEAWRSSMVMFNNNSFFVKWFFCKMNLNTIFPFFSQHFIILFDHSCLTRKCTGKCLKINKSQIPQLPRNLLFTLTLYLQRK